MKARFPRLGAPWVPTLLVFVVVVLAGGRLIALSVEQRAERLREAAQAHVSQYSREIQAQLNSLAQAASADGAPRELDGLLAQLPLNEIIDPSYDFALTKIGAGNATSRVFVSTRIESMRDGMANVIRVPAGYAQDLPGGYLELAIRPESGWYPARDLALAIALLAAVAWLLTFATHDLVHSLQRAQEALAHARRQAQATHRKLLAAIEERESLQRNFEHSRFHDGFTGLPNRRHFMDQLDRALRELRTQRRARIAVLLINIDRFKLINDTLGHTAGDELIVQVARRFQRVAAPMDGIVARWSADQFAVLAPQVDSADQALQIAASLRNELQTPIEIRRLRLAPAARIGFTCVATGLQRAEEIVREADIALSVAKRQESTDPVMYQAAMGGSFASLVSLEADLHLALERRELHLQFQPIVDLRARRAVGAEALLRWRHPVEGMLAPEQFLGIAEDVGLMIPITRWTIRGACQIAAQWQRSLPQAAPYVSMNLSAAALRDRELSAYVERTVGECGTPAELLKFELTEGGLIDDPLAAREVLDALHALGVEMMLDDFGTGYSSLSYLQLFPFDFVKIDRPFVDRPGAERTNSALAAAIVQMAAGLGLKSIAESVETSDAAHDLQRMGCDYAQGFYFCKPLEAPDALEVMRSFDAAVPQSGESAVAIDDTLILPLESVQAGLRSERG